MSVDRSPDVRSRLPQRVADDEMETEALSYQFSWAIKKGFAWSIKLSQDG